MDNDTASAITLHALQIGGLTWSMLIITTGRFYFWKGRRN